MAESSKSIKIQSYTQFFFFSSLGTIEISQHFKLVVYIHVVLLKSSPEQFKLYASKESNRFLMWQFKSKKLQITGI